MVYFKTEQYAQRVRKTGQTMRLDCTLSDCPRFSDCKVIPAHGLLFGQSKAQLIFATDLTTEDEEEFRLPAINPAGRLLRESMLAHILTKKKVPFLITKLFRANTDGKPPRVFESKLCFSHFHKELLQHTPKLVVALGMSVFSTLYTHAVNKHELPPKDEHTMSSLRGKFFTFAFDGVAVRVFVTHNPGSVLQTAALYKLFKDDANTIADFFVTGAECSLKETIEIKSIERLDTVKGVFDYLDFLRYGLKESSLVAFDTETRNLNRRYNNAFLTWQFCHEPGKAVVIPIEHRDQPLFADKKHRQALVEKMSGLLNATTAETKINFFIAHNLKFDLSVLWGLMGIIPRDPRVNIPWWCTMLAAHWLDENRKGLAGFLSGSPYSLKTFGVEYFNFYFEEEALDRRGDGALEELTLDQLSQYGGSDVILTRALAVHQVNKIAADEPDNAAAKLKKFVKHYYFPTSRALAVLECNGIYVKSDHLSYLQGEDSPVWNRMEDIEGKLQNLPDVLDFRQTYKEKIGGKVKNASAFETSLWDMPAEDLPLLDLNKQDQQKLFFLDYLRLIPLKMSRKTGLPQLNAKFLDHYANSNVYKETNTIKKRFSDYYGVPVSKDDGSSVYRENPLTLTLEYRKLKTLGTRYLDALEGFLRNPRGDCVDSRVRASYLAHGTDTGRLCVPGHTKILVVTEGNEGELKGRPIADVKVGDLAYCYDNALNLRIRKVVWSGKTGTKPVVRLHWKAGTRKKGYLDLTPDHPVRLIDGSYREAAKLAPGDSVLSAFKAPFANREQKYAKVYARQGSPTKEHRLVFEQMYGYSPPVVHHKDHNPLNNHPSNLEAMAVAEHTTHHTKIHWQDGVFDNRPTKGKGHYLYNHIGRFSFIRVLAECKGQHRNSKYSDHPKLIKNRSSFKRRCIEFGINKRIIALRYDVDGNYISRGRLKKLCNEMMRYKIRAILKIGNEQLGELASFYGLSFIYNHEVVRIEWLPGEVDVYDLEVDEFHNFIANEICVHNSSNSPNLQQLPGRGKVAKAVKNMFQAEPPSEKFPHGTILLQCDYKTAEVRWAALFAKDRNLIKVFQDSSRIIKEAIESGNDADFESANLLADLHRRTASLMFNLPANQVSSSMRQSAKCVVGSTLLYTDKGILPIESLVTDPNDENWAQPVVGVKTASKNGFVDILCVNHKWVDETIEIETDIGLKVEGDVDHRMLVWRDCTLIPVALKDLCEGDLLVALVAEVKFTAIIKKTHKVGRQKVYDIEVDDPSHTFYASGLLSKNCITFGLLFGMAVKTLSENNGWTLEEGEEKLEKYFSAFPDLEKFLKLIPEVAKKKGYVETFMGRRRRLGNFLEMGKLADSYKHMSEGERKAMNASIQGQSSDAGTIGMFSFVQSVFDNNLENRWLVQNVVHDSTLVQVPWEDARLALDKMSHYFVTGMREYIEQTWNCKLAIDIEIEFEIGLKYGALEKWDGRKKALDAILDKLEKEKADTWKKVERKAKPPKVLDLVTFQSR